MDLPRCLLILAGAVVLPCSQAEQFDIVGPAGSEAFGTHVSVLGNGNIVVADPLFDSPGGDADIGAVYLYDLDGGLISTMIGSSAGDQVGSGGITVLLSGHYVVASPLWRNGAMAAAGAATWCDRDSGVNDAVSPANSLVGSRPDDRVGTSIIRLANGNYLVRSILWDDGAVANVGAVTWGDGFTGVTGAVSQANSLIGSAENDQVGFAIMALGNGHYLVRSPVWDRGATVNAGAVTWGDGASGISGIVSSLNSLVGGSIDDRVGGEQVSALGNGNFVVTSQRWDNGAVTDAGAATWGDGNAGIAGEISADNSLVGSSPGDRVGSFGVAAVGGGNYVVLSPAWDDASIQDAGAVTWADGAAGISGEVSAFNSLVGSNAGDQVGSNGVAVLANGNYVVGSPLWDDSGRVDAGAATWAAADTGISGTISAANSLVGATDGDRVGSSGVFALPGGHFVVASPRWDAAGASDAGAATWGDGTAGTVGAVSAANSLVGSSSGDRVAENGVTALANGHYVVKSPFWSRAGASQVGAATWVDGSMPFAAVVSSDNSLIGSRPNDNVGGSVAALFNGNYVVRSPFWDREGVADAGAVTWRSGAGPGAGQVSESNSLVGRSFLDRIGFSGVAALANGHYVVRSPLWDREGIRDAGAATWGNGKAGVIGEVSERNSLVGSSESDEIGDLVFGLSDGNYIMLDTAWDNGALVNAGAVTLGLGDKGSTGPISPVNSVLSQVAHQGAAMDANYQSSTDRLIVGRPRENIVTVFRPERLFRSGFESTAD